MLNLNDQSNINHNIILDRFKKGEINISQAFSLLTGINEPKNEAKIKPVIKQHTPKKEVLLKPASQLDRYLNEMNQLIGLDNVKKMVTEFISFLQIQQIRQQHGLKCQPVVLHMIFKGNPGTGKTTMARLIGKIFKELGFLETGEIVETERADLVGEYIGHTALKTRKLIQKAMGGVLFIDEAYSLARGGEKDFGKESIDTMVKAMEDHKDNLVIILAGYRNEMEYFLDTNPGLRSRFAIQLDFPDFSIDQLVQVAEIMFKEREYILDKESKHYIYRVLTYLRNKEGSNNGNARTVRNLVEKSIRHQARRIMEERDFSRDNLIKITKQDLAGEVLLDD